MITLREAVLRNSNNLGRPHQHPLPIPAGWDWRNLSKGNANYSKMGQIPRAEARLAIARIPGPPEDTVRIRFSPIQYYAFVPSAGWSLGFSDDPEGAFLGAPGRTDDPFDTPNRGVTNFVRQNNGTYVVQWAADQSTLLHAWAGRRHPYLANQTAELAVCTYELETETTQKFVGQTGIDFYQPGENNRRAPGPGIGWYQEMQIGVPLVSAWLTVPSVTTRKITIDGHDKIYVFDDPNGLNSWIDANGLPDVQLPGIADVADSFPQALTNHDVPKHDVLPDASGTTDDPIDMRQGEGDGRVMIVAARGKQGDEMIDFGIPDNLPDGHIARCVKYELPRAGRTFMIQFDGKPPEIRFINDHGNARDVLIERISLDWQDIDLSGPMVMSNYKWDPADGRCGIVRIGPGGEMHCNGWLRVLDPQSAPAPPILTIPEPLTAPETAPIPAPAPMAPEASTKPVERSPASNRATSKIYDALADAHRALAEEYRNFIIE